MNLNCGGIIVPYGRGFFFNSYSSTFTMIFPSIKSVSLGNTSYLKKENKKDLSNLDRFGYHCFCTHFSSMHV